MREIKFRAWSTRTYGDNDKKGGWYEFAKIDTNGHVLWGDGRVDEKRELIVSQFTGCKDAKGIDIYEGDIIRFGWNPFFHEESEIFEFAQPVV